ncbi:MAG: VCBS repeat-containing protein, partial [Planctomycetes bacterium]|nr:VCBS repeat-containing protein [Planctomycetota bacterium]
YRNTTVPVDDLGFTEQTGSGNPLDGVDAGSWSSLTLGDLDGDGDLDLIAGNQNGTFNYYKNTGTAIAPVFTAQTGADNPLDGFDAGGWSRPTLGDLDGDGDLDLIVANDNGLFWYYTNSGTATAPAFTAQTGTDNPLNGVDLGIYATTTLGDLDGDGDLDLIAGVNDGTFKYFLNTTVPID